MTIYTLDFVGYTSTLMLLIGFFGLFTAETVVGYLISAELLFLALSFKFILYSILFNSISGQIFALFILAVGGAETAVLLGIYVLFSKTGDLNSSLNERDNTGL
jgi:NADH:ubiquinone oxidoreductase subunit K